MGGSGPRVRPRLAPILFVGALFLLTWLRRPSDPGWTEFVGDTMGTRYSVKVVGALDDDSSDRLRGVIMDALDAVDQSMSTYREESVLSRFNLFDGGGPFPVPAELAVVALTAQSISEASDGAFDVTVGPLVDAWGFGAGSAGVAAPSDSLIAVLLRDVGYLQLHVQVSPPSLWKDRPGLRVDLSAIAKGYGVDQVARELVLRGYPNHLVEVGGEVRCGGLNHLEEPWSIGIESPDKGTAEPFGIVQLSDAAVATSGSYRNWRVVDGKRVSHTIDPRTGQPVDHRIVSVTVIHPLCVVADAQATAISVLGIDEGMRYARSEGLAVRWLYEDDTEALQEQATEAFSRYRKVRSP